MQHLQRALEIDPAYARAYAGLANCDSYLLCLGDLEATFEAILADFPSLSGFQVYACGSAGMVEAAHPAFRARGLAQDDCFSDAFRPSPQLVRLGGAA